MSSQPLRHLSLILPALVVVSGVAYGLRPSQQDRIAALEARIAELEAGQTSALRRLDQMRLDLDNTLEPLRVRLADQGEDVRALGSRLAAVEEQLVLINERLLSIADGLAGGVSAAAARPAAGTPMPPPQRPAGVPGPSIARAAAVAEPQPTTARSEADSLYSAAYTDYLAANYSLAIDGFGEYVRLFPDSERADNAQYWIGESHYSQQQYQLARTAFQQVSRRYPDGDTVPDALFKAARCLVELGDAPRAIDELVRLVREHPLSDTAPIACTQIERLGAEKPLGCPGN